MSEIKIRHAGGVACDCHPASQADESRGFPLTGGDSAPSADELASSRREAYPAQAETLEDWPESWAITVMRHIRRNVII